MTAAFEGVPFGRLHYRHLEHDKIIALKNNKGNFEETCNISKEGFSDIIWWKENILTAKKSLHPHPKPDYVIYTDASKEGWGATDKSVTINGRWNNREKEWHINILELLAIKYALLSLLNQIKGKYHVRIMSDNATAIPYINKQGGSKSI